MIVGGNGPRRTPALAARYASEFNLAFPELDTVADKFAGVRRACAEIDRPADELVLSAAFVLCVGRDEAEFRRRAQAIGREPDELREHGLAGTPGEVAERLRWLGEQGATRTYLQVLDLADLDHLALVAEEVVPQLT